MLRHKHTQSAFCEINVTPFIDIMLVLLIIFMALAPLITSSLNIELPKMSEAVADKQKEINIFLNKDEISLNNEPVSFENLGFKLAQIAQKEQIIFLHIDKKVEYERIVELMQVLKNGGFDKIALATELK